MKLQASQSVANTYWNIIKHLNKDVKLELIVLLTQSLQHPRKQTVSAHDFYGIWGDDGMSDDEFVSELRKARRFKKELIEI